MAMSLRKRMKQLLGNVVYRFNPGRVSQVRDVAIPAFHDLGPGDLAIDCGANRGLIARILGANGAEVHAFEPNPDAYAALVDAVRDLPNVHCHNAAVLDRPGRMTLFLHLNYDRNPERFSEGSTLIAEKRNVDESRGVEVEVVDLVQFVLDLGRPVQLLKVDIEGAEYDLLEGMIARGALERVEKVFVETHARAIASLVPRDQALRARIAELGLGDKIDMNWV
jgi:FkbM family methyltransferase